ncbi:MAG: DUF302 domain-containing protein [Patescibacteria group bacterium]
MNYGYKKQVGVAYDEAIERVKMELTKEGFGVLSEIDVQATLKKKLDVDYDKYIILGACNPSFAHQALLSEPDIGLLLPCNVVVYERDGAVFVSAIRPQVAMSVVDSNGLESIAQEVESKLIRVIDNL